MYHRLRWIISARFGHLAANRQSSSSSSQRGWMPGFPTTWQSVMLRRVVSTHFSRDNQPTGNTHPGMFSQEDGTMKQENQILVIYSPDKYVFSESFPQIWLDKTPMNFNRTKSIYWPNFSTQSCYAVTEWERFNVFQFYVPDDISHSQVRVGVYSSICGNPAQFDGISFHMRLNAHIRWQFNPLSFSAVTVLAKRQ